MIIPTYKSIEELIGTIEESDLFYLDFHKVQYRKKALLTHYRQSLADAYRHNFNSAEEMAQDIWSRIASGETPTGFAQHTF